MASAALEKTQAALEVIAQPPPGTVLPPKEIRTILEKTAGYVARNGPTFESRIRQKEASNPKFSFLTTNDPYNSYYLWRLSEIQAGRGTAISAGRDTADAIPLQPRGPEPPPDFTFSARMPNISAQDLEVLKLTAFFVAKNGRTFMTTLSQRESTNYQFDFLRPQHSFYQYFSRLVDQYSILLNAAPDSHISVVKSFEDKGQLMARAKQRALWVRFQEQQKRKEQEAADAERIAYAQIDWHDFVVVEMITFTDGDDDADFPPPTSLADLQSASLEQKAMMSLQPNNRRIEEAMPTDDYYMPQSESMPTPLPTSQSFNQAQVAPAAEVVPSPVPVDAPDSGRVAQNAPIKIRNDYIPRAQAQRRQAQTAICPNCRQAVPADELSEHMRIELLDPRWREQKAKAESRYSTTNLSTADVANNLKRLASQRTDVFDNASGEIVGEEEAARRKRAAMSYNGIIPGVNDGSVGPAQAGASKAALQAQARERAASGNTIDEQLRRIQEKARNQ